MKQIDITTTLTQYDSLEALSKEVQLLFKKAIEARKKAYAPYSRFQVGAAILLNNKQIVTGNNQENAAYPSGMCAERVAVWNAYSQFPENTITKMVITATSLNKKVTAPIPPCGACRQTLSEYEINQKSPIKIYFMGEIGAVYKVDSLKALLPLMFDNSVL